jgi:periplasmic protein TonB
MPADLFRSAVPSTPARRRASLLPISLITHVAVIAVAVLMPVLADGELPPVVRSTPAYVSIELPPPPPPAPARPATPATASASNPALPPVEAPPAILPEPAVTPPAAAIGDAMGEGIEGVPDGVFGSTGAPVAALPPPPPPAQKQPVRPGGRIEAPRVVTRVQPVYPSIAQASRVGGIVVIEALIGEDGRVRDATVLRGHQLLKDAALDAVGQWVFTPTRLNGEPVAVLMTVTVVFSLN